MIFLAGLALDIGRKLIPNLIPLTNESSKIRLI
jgi:hypothetical protein